MNISFVINSLNRPAGTERVTSLLANEFANNGHNVTIIALHYGGTPFFSLDKHIDVYYLNNKSQTNIYINYPINVIKLRQKIKKIKTEIVIDVCSAMSLMSIPSTIFTKVRVITWEHFNAKINWNPISSPLARKLASLFAYKIITLTNSDRDEYKKRYKANNVQVIPNPITIEPAAPSSLQTKIVLAIGRMEHQKGFDMLIEAWKQCKSKENGWQLKIVGEGELKADLLNQIDLNNLRDSIIVSEPTSNVVELYQEASIYVMSSRFEGLPLVLIEAMAMGLPIISFDCQTGPRDIVKNGINGQLIAPNDTTALAQAIDELTSNRKILKEYSNNSIELSKKFELQSIIKLWQNVLK